MPAFKSVLLLSDASSDETDAFKQALAQVKNNGADLEVLLLPPTLPKSLADRQQELETALIEQAKSRASAAASEIGLDLASAAIEYHVERGDRFATLAVRHVLRRKHDLVVKHAAPSFDNKGFDARDLELLRKSPVPVWLCKPIPDPQPEMQVAVALDPDCRDQSARDLAVRLLRVGHKLAKDCNGVLLVLSAWDYPYERYLSRNAFISVTPEEVRVSVQAAHDEHREKLDAILKEADIGDNVNVELMRGAADEVVPVRCAGGGVDVLVMGTTARTGLAELIVGNTAENVLKSLTCSLLALKPADFVSPVKPY